MDESCVTVLIAEDDVDDQEMIKDAFRHMDGTFNLIAVSNGIQLMDFLLKRHQFSGTGVVPDLILLDISMPIMNGFDVLVEISKHASLSQIPVYLVTSSRDVDQLEKALDLGARGFYIKGSSDSEIRRIVAEICGK